MDELQNNVLIHKRVCTLVLMFVLFYRWNLYFLMDLEPSYVTKVLECDSLCHLKVIIQSPTFINFILMVYLKVFVRPHHLSSHSLPLIIPQPNHLYSFMSDWAIFTLGQFSCLIFVVIEVTSSTNSCAKIEYNEYRECNVLSVH